MQKPQAKTEMTSQIKVGHDSINPPNLISFMLKNWKKPTAKLPGALKNLKYIQARRKTLSSQFLGEFLIIPTGHLKVRANDQFYPFRPSSDFYYLTGNMEPDCVLVMEPTAHGHKEILYVEHNPGKTDATFFTDRVKGELWEGARLGVSESRAKYGIADTRALHDLEKDLVSFSRTGKYRILRDQSLFLEKFFDSSEMQKKKDQEMAVFLSEMRLIKDKSEVQALADAVNATQRGFEDVIRRMKTAKSERELEGVFHTRARMEGNDVGYGSIVASGAHGCTLHWRKMMGTSKRGLAFIRRRD